MPSLQNPREGVEAGKIRLSPEDVQAAGKANIARSDFYPEAHMKDFFRVLLSPEFWIGCRISLTVHMFQPYM